MRFLSAICIAVLFAVCAVAPIGTTVCEADGEVSQFMDCVLPMPITGELSTDCWGAAEVGLRDPSNGLEDTDLSDYSYWDGGIIKDEISGMYYMFGSRWAQSDGHWGDGESTFGWRSSQAVYATSESLIGPYEDKGALWPSWCEGAGHNVYPFAISASDPLFSEGYRYAIIISDVGLHKKTANGAVHISKSLDGEWELLPNDNGGKLDTANYFSFSNVCICTLPEGGYIAVNRDGTLLSSKTLLGRWKTESSNLWGRINGLPKNCIEDPLLWYSGGIFHMIVNKWDTKNAYYLISADGLTGWTCAEGLAYSGNSDFLRYEDGTVNRWAKLERPNVYLENGEVKAMTFAVVNSEKEADLGNDSNGSKIIVVPFSAEAIASLDAATPFNTKNAVQTAISAKLLIAVMVAVCTFAVLSVLCRVTQKCKKQQR